MITIKKNAYNAGEKAEIRIAMQAAVDKFINTHCDAKEHCYTCQYKHACYDLIKARDYDYKISMEGEANDPS